MMIENSKNALHEYLDEEALALAKKYQHEIESVAFGKDSGCGYKNDIFVNQDALKEVDIDLQLAENIAHYVSGLLGGKGVYQG